MSRPKDSRGSNRYKDNALMIEKLFACAEPVAAASVQRERIAFRADIGRAGMEQRQAAQAKRQRKQQQRLEREKRDARWKAVGHDPDSDMCGCELCAARADRGELGRWP